MSLRPDDFRRKWDKKEYERKALDRIQKIKKGDEREFVKFQKVDYIFMWCV